MTNLRQSRDYTKARRFLDDVHIYPPATPLLFARAIDHMTLLGEQVAARIVTDHEPSGGVTILHTLCQGQIRIDSESQKVGAADPTSGATRHSDTNPLENYFTRY